MKVFTFYRRSAFKTAAKDVKMTKQLRKRISKGLKKKVITVVTIEKKEQRVFRGHTSHAEVETYGADGKVETYLCDLRSATNH